MRACRSELAVPHERSCREDDCEAFVCVWCRRSVPACFGGCGVDRIEHDLCNDCWCEREAFAVPKQDARTITGRCGT
jgi:hypothetical protein